MEIRHAVASELDKVCEILACEFYNDPVLRHAFMETDRERRMAALRYFFRIQAELALKHGGILLAENDDGVMVYFRPGFMEEKEESDDSRLRQAYGVDYPAVTALMNELNHHHPLTPPHYYIFAVAVQRSCRGSCVVKKLFNELNEIMDRDGYPCYAECTTFSTRTLVRRFGYHDAGPPVRISGFPELFPIWRKPQ